MNRARRLLFTIVSLVSVLVFTATTGFWIRSYWRSDEFRIEHERAWIFQSNLGIFEFSVLSEHSFTTNNLREAINRWPFPSLPPGSILRPVSSSLQFKHSTSAPINFFIPMRNRIVHGSAGETGSSSLPHSIGMQQTLYTAFSRIGPSIYIPAWMIVLPAAPLPALWVWQFRKSRLAVARQLAGACLSCGYDLRATPARCPECGAIPEPKPVHFPGGFG
jgi:hypothetical protein